MLRSHGYKFNFLDQMNLHATCTELAAKILHEASCMCVAGTAID